MAYYNSYVSNYTRHISHGFYFILFALITVDVKMANEEIRQHLIKYLALSLLYDESRE